MGFQSGIARFGYGRFQGQEAGEREHPATGTHSEGSSCGVEEAEGDPRQEKHRGSENQNSEAPGGDGAVIGWLGWGTGDSVSEPGEI